METFKEYWSALPPDEKRALAQRAQTSPNYLAQIAGANRLAGAALMARLCQADPRITHSMLRPDLYA